MVIVACPCSLGLATPVAIMADTGRAIAAASDLTLMRGDLSGVATAIRLSRRTYRTILQNLGWAFGYNTAAIPLAALGLLNPVIAGAAMGISSVSVVTNSLRLLRFRENRRSPHATAHIQAGGPARVRVRLADGGWIEGHGGTAGEPVT